MTDIAQDLTAQPPPARTPPRIERWLPLAVLAVTLGITADVWRNAQAGAERDFAYRMQKNVSLLEQHMAGYQDVLRGVSGLLSSFDVTRTEFRDYVAALNLRDNHPGLRGLGFAKWIAPQDKAGFIASMTKQGQPDYRIRPDGERAAYAPVVFREALTGDDPLQPGIDIYADPIVREAADYARDNGTVAISGKVPMWSSGGTRLQPGFTMLLPVYDKYMPDQSVEQRRSHLLGWVSAPVRIADLVAPMSPDRVADVDIALYEGNSTAPSALIFTTDQATDFSPDRSRYQSVSKIRVANREWTVSMRSLPRLENQLPYSPTLKAVAGAIISVLLALVTWLLLRSRARALQTAQALNRALVEREERYRDMFERSASIAFLLDPANGRIVDANLAAQAFWGYPLDQLRRMKIDRIDMAASGGIRVFMKRIKPGVASRLECQHRLADGSVREVELYAGTLEHQGKTLIFASLHDITARKQAERALRASEERYRLIAENTTDVIWMMDAESLRFTYMSPSIERQRGFTPEEIMEFHRNVANSTSSTLAPAMPQMAERLRERILHFKCGDESKRREVIEIDQPHKDGRMIPVEVVTTLLGDSTHVRALVGVSRDITARRQAQEEQKRFIAMVSHEFRTPLATIDGAVQRLKATATHADVATINRYTKIQSAVDRLTGLLDAYLNNESIGTLAQSLHLSTISPLTLLRDCEESAKALSPEHHVTVDAANAPTDLVCDADRMRLTLRVLTDNAVKYTPAGSHVMLCARTSARGGVEFIVADNGDGIPEDELPQLFKRYFRGRRAQWQSGSGLGLDMARTVAEMHGGGISVRNRPEGGAEFTLWLPDTTARTRRYA